MLLYNFIREFWVPALGALGFLTIQTGGNFSEESLTLYILVLSCLLFLKNNRVGELHLYFVGVLVGILVEVGFRILGYQQIWHDASFFGVPYWLPLIWGAGFVLITRLGVYVRDLPTVDDRPRFAEKHIFTSLSN